MSFVPWRRLLLATRLDEKQRPGQQRERRRTGTGVNFRNWACHRGARDTDQKQDHSDRFAQINLRREILRNCLLRTQRLFTSFCDCESEIATRTAAPARWNQKSRRSPERRSPSHCLRSRSTAEASQSFYSHLTPNMKFCCFGLSAPNAFSY